MCHAIQNSCPTQITKTAERLKACARRGPGRDPLGMFFVGKSVNKCEIPSNVHLQEVILSWKLNIDFRSAFLKVDPLLGCLCVSNCVNVREVDTAHVFYPGFYE